MVNEYLFLFEKRLRAFTEHFRVTEWLVLYHNQIVAESYCFRHHASKNNRSAKGGKKVFLHEQYPVFFKTVNSVKTELNTTALKLGVDNQPLLAQLFGHINSTDMIGLIGVTNSRGSKEHFATIFFSNKTTKLSPSTNFNEVRQAEKKTLVHIARLLGDYLGEHKTHSVEQIRYRWNETVAPIINSTHFKNNETSHSRLKHFVHGIKSSINADDFQLYWVSDDFYPLVSAGSTSVATILKPAELDARRFILKNNFNVHKKVEIWNGKNLNVHSKIKTQLGEVLKHTYPTLWLTFSFNEKQRTNILGPNFNKTNKSQLAHLVIELVRAKTKTRFSTFEIDFVAEAQLQLEKYFLQSDMLNDLRDVVQQQLKTYTTEYKHNPEVNEDTSGVNTIVNSVAGVATDAAPLYYTAAETHQEYEVVYAQRQFTASRFVTRSKTSDHGYFYFGDLSALNEVESYFVQAGFDYLQNETLDVIALEKQIIRLTGRLKKPIGYALVDFPPHQTNSKKPSHMNVPETFGLLGLFGNGVNFYQYAFETGKLKPLNNYPQRMVIELASQDLVIALPKPLSGDQKSRNISEGIMQTLEKELVIWGHSRTDELGKVVGNALAGALPHFVLVKKN